MTICPLTPVMISDFYAYERSRYYRGLNKQSRLDTQYFFAFQNGAEASVGTIPTAPAARPKRQSEREVSNVAEIEDEDAGACGIAVDTGLTAAAQEKAESIGTCDQLRQIYGSM